MQTHAALTQENQRRWMLRSHASGDIRYFQGFDELHRWILQGAVSKHDAISRTGRRWKALHSVGEFMPIFQALDSISSITEAREKQPSLGLPSADSSPKSPAARPPKPPAAKPPKPPAARPPKPPAGNASTPMSRAAGLPRDFASQPRVTTSRQFALPPTQKAGRTRTPISSKAWAATPPEAPQHPAQTPTHAHQASPKTRPYGDTSPEHPATPDDDWSLGELPLSVAEGHEFDPRGRELSGAHARSSFTDSSGQYASIDHAAHRSASSRSKVPIILAAVLVIGAGIALYTVYPPFVADILGPKSSTAALSNETAPVETPEATDSPEAQVDLAAQKATDDAIAAQNKKRLAAIDAAQPHLSAALAAGLKEADAAVPEEPKQLSVNALLANAKRSLDAGKSEQARQQFHQVLSRDRSNSSAITGLGWSLIALNRSPAAAAQFGKAIALNPRYGDAYIGLGRAKRDMGDHQGALDAYQGYLNKFPSGSKASIARHQADKLKLALGQ